MRANRLSPRTRSLRRQRLVLALVGAMTAPAALAQSLPTGGTVVSGGATIGSTGATTTVNQTTQGAIINWNSFNIGSGYGVTFNQPNASSVVLNRVIGSGYGPIPASNIDGTLSANGHVFLVNTAGITFGGGAQVNVAGLVASTIDMSNADFNAGVTSGRYVFSGTSGTGEVRNNGTITATKAGTEGGRVAFVGTDLQNSGTINATGGSVVFGAASSVTLDFQGDGLTQVTVDGLAASTIIATAQNYGDINADGGQILMRALANPAGQGGVVNGGTLRARTLASRAGRVELTAAGGGVLLGDMRDGYLGPGIIDVTGAGPGLTGGSVLLDGADVTLLSDVRGARPPSRIDAFGGAGGGSVEIFASNQVNLLPTTTINADATNAGNGGTVRIIAGNDLNASGGISANGGQATGNGGSIALQSVAGNALIDGSLRANGGSSGNGGDILVLANAGGVLTSGVVSANGGANGGRVGLAGLGVVVGETSTLSADGASGQGGQIQLAARTLLAAYGGLTARGGTTGGRVETLSGGTFDIRGLRVQAGGGSAAGEWTITAPNLTVIDGNAAGTVATPVLGTNVQDADLNFALNAGTSITLRAGFSPGDAGNINFQPGVDIAATSGTLPLWFRANARGSISGNGFAIRSGAGPLSMAFNSDADNLNNGFGGISFDGATLDSRGGDILFYGQSDTVNGFASSSATGASLVRSSIATGGGSVLIRGSSTGAAAGSDDAGVVLDGTSVNAGSGTVTLYGSGAGPTSGVILRASPLSGGPVLIDGRSANADGVYALGSNILSSGAISLTGVGGARGVYFSGNLTSAGGDIAVDGQGTAGEGIDLLGTVASGGGDIDLAGRSAAATGLAFGGGAASGISSGGGAIRLAGSGVTGGVSLRESAGGSDAVDSGGGAIDVTGTASGAGAVGVRAQGVSLVGGTGNVTVDGSAPLGTGVLFAGGAGARTTSGAITLIGEGANFGLDLADGAINTTSGDIALVGNALAAGATAGVRLTGGGLSTNGGSISVVGTSAGGAGVQLGTGGAFAIASGGGDIDISGSGVTAGVVMRGNTVDSGGGDIDVAGDATAAGGIGVDLADARLIASTGDVDVFGRALAGTGLSFAGLSAITTTTGAIGLTGIGANVGLALDGGTLGTTSGHFDLRGRGTAAGSSGLLIGAGMNIATAGGGIELSGEGVGGAGIALAGGSRVDAGNSLVVIRAANDGSSDAIRIGGTIASTLGVNLRPGGVDANGGLTERVGDTILLGAGGNGFALTSAELGLISAPQLVVGSNLHAGAIQVSGAISRAGNLTLQNDGGAGGIDVQAALDVGGGTLALSSGGNITQTAAGAITAHSLLARAGGNVLLATANNNVAANTLAGSAGGEFRYQDVDALSIGTVSAQGINAATNGLAGLSATGITAGGNVFVRNLAGNLILNAGVRGADIDLVTANTLQNFAGAGSLVASGEWRVWANTWVGETRGGLSGSGALPNLYGCNYQGQCGVTVPASDNHFIYVQQPTAVVTFNNATREYGLPNPLFTFSVTGGILGDSGANVATGTPTTTATIGSNVGNYPISGIFSSAAGYRIQLVPGTLAITPATLLFTANSFIRYLGTANPPFSGTVTGFRNGDTVQSVFGNGVIWNSPAGLLSPIGFYPVIGGTSATNYVFVQAPGNATALQIVPLPQLSSTPIDLIRETVNTYVYDRNFGGAPMCAVNASLEDQQLVSTGDELSNEWSKVRSRPNLTNCFETERKNSCGDF